MTVGVKAIFLNSTITSAVSYSSSSSSSYYISNYMVGVSFKNADYIGQGLM